MGVSLYACYVPPCRMDGGWFHEWLRSDRRYVGFQKRILENLIHSLYVPRENEVGSTVTEQLHTLGFIGIEMANEPRIMWKLAICGRHVSLVPAQMIVKNNNPQNWSKIWRIPASRSCRYHLIISWVTFTCHHRLAKLIHSSTHLLSGQPTPTAYKT